MIRRFASVLPALQAKIRDSGLSALYVPLSDPHHSEYLPDHYQAIKFISGFTGSAAQAIITQSRALLWTDSRYWIQAEREVQPPWEVLRTGAKDVPKLSDWLRTHMKPSDKVGFLGDFLPAEEVHTKRKELAESGVEFQSLTRDLVGEVWSGRPERPRGRVFPHEEVYTGRGISDKAVLVCKEMSKSNSHWLLSSDLTEVAWLLNLRGSDIPFNPVFYAYLLLERGEGDTFALTVFSDYCEVLQSLISSPQVRFLPYSGLPDFLSALRNEVICDKSTLNFSLYERISKPKHCPSIISRLKSVKSDTELAGFRSAHVRDAAAFLRFWAWMDSAMRGQTVTEREAAAVIDGERAKLPLFHSLSFDTIAASGENAAVVHYRPSGNVEVKKNAVFLLDSGGHYLDGTTDITRTLHFSSPSPAEKAAYTRVLQGHLDLQRTKWPSDSSVSGSDLDCIARRPLWSSGLDYKHGTGHGVGHFLSVHEGPPRISKTGTTPLQAGVVLSNEPGVYVEGKFGIRIENLMEVAKDEDSEGFLRFQALTRVPYDRKLIDLELLRAEDIAYIDKYHADIRSTLQSLFSSDPVALSFLHSLTAPL